MDWRDIPGLPGYQASPDGRIRRVRACRNGWRPRELAGYVNPIGYRVVTVTVDGVQRPRFVHRLVCAAFHGPSPSPQHEVAHGDGDTQNNCEDNLRWATRADNAADRRRHGRDTIGERHGMARLAAADVAEIRRLAEGGLPQRRIAALFGIHQAQVHRIATGKSWGHLFAPADQRRAAA